MNQMKITNTTTTAAAAVVNQNAEDHHDNNNNGGNSSGMIDEEDGDSSTSSRIIDEVMVIANAYRQAHDEDTMEVMRAQSTKKESDITNLHFYAIEADWMHRAWPMLHGQIPTKLGPNWREDVIGRIENDLLLFQAAIAENDNNNNNAIRNSALVVSNCSSDNELDNNNSKNKNAQIPQQQSQKQDLLSEISNTKHSSGSNNNPSAIHLLQNRLLWKQQQQQKQRHSTSCIQLRNNAILHTDYFLVGSNVWLLLKQKFGYDVEIKCKCELVQSTVVDHPKGSTTTESTASRTNHQHHHYLAVIVPQEQKKMNNDNTNNDDTPLLGGEKRQQDDSNIIRTNGATMIATTSYPIPPTGRFPYEDFLSTTDLKKQKTTTSDISSNNNDSVINNKLIKYGVPAPVPRIVPLPAEHNNNNPGSGNNVSDDDDDNDNDEIFYVNEGQPNHSGNDENLTKVSMKLPLNSGLQQSPILLLPPSTTVVRSDNIVHQNNDDYWLDINGNNDSNNNISTSAAGPIDDDYQYDDDDDKASSSDILSGSAVALAAVTPRRRPYGSGLGNLGNTCFMNSTLQCLAHTEPLQKYFLSREYENDLNRDNPLGTGGELAMQFARLLSEMYIVEPPRPIFGTNNTRTTRYSSSYASSMDISTTTNVVYPRNFKNTLGRHAEQFMGYDQHDSQELATYLLDALHEDTNRVTTKPYVEKPEQGESESDEEAAQKAWALHLKREDSRVLENFMGLVKSRVECCEAGCGRVSTTFDPVMYLSVPIPGSSEKTLQVTYVPCEPTERPKSLSISILKSANIEDLLKKVRDQVNENFPSLAASTVTLEDLCPTDVWQKEVNAWFTYKEEVDKIRENDMTFVYELRSAKEIRRQFEEKQNNSRMNGNNSSDNINGNGSDEADAERLGIAGGNRVRYYQLDISTLTRLNKGEEWSDRMRDYLRSPLGFINAFNPKKGTTEDRVKLYRQLIRFLDLCYKEAEAAANPYADEGIATGQKRTREDNKTEESKIGRPVPVSEDDKAIPDVEDRCSSSPFNSVRSRYDLAVLEFLAGKMRREILELEQRRKQLYPDGIIIEICMRRIGTYAGEKQSNISAPFVVRVSSEMTVYELRKEIAKRISRSIRTPSTGVGWPTSTTATGQSPSEDVASIDQYADAVEDESKSNSIREDNNSFGSSALLVLRQIPLSYERYSYRTYRKSEQLGSIAKADVFSDGGTRPIPLASPTDEEERALVSEFVGNHDRVFLEWPSDLVDRSFDLKEYESVDDHGMLSPVKNKTVTVLDCIDKFCHKEQLEETEQWYCNKCQKHVRAWKQFHIYKSPPHLIVHLKRFHYSATTHRRNKLNLMIDFPLVGFDLSEHVSQWRDEDNDKPVYDCYAVTNHFGGLGGGHYTAYALNPDGVWCLYDDSRITSHVDPKEVVSPAAYVLYYRRRDVPVGEEYEFGLQTSLPHSIGTAVVVAPTPAIIQNDPEIKSHSPSSEISSGASNASSNAAMIGDDEDDVMDDIMNSNANDDDITDEENISSRATSPMNSVADGNDDEPSNLFVMEHDYDNDSRHRDDHPTVYASSPSKSNHVKHSRGGGNHQLPLQ